MNRAERLGGRVPMINVASPVLDVQSGAGARCQTLLDFSPSSARGVGETPIAMMTQAELHFRGAHDTLRNHLTDFVAAGCRVCDAPLFLLLASCAASPKEEHWRLG